VEREGGADEGKLERKERKTEGDALKGIYIE
jgi:hypothetical protein